MKLFSKRPATPADSGRVDRRTLVVGAGVAGAAAVGARALSSAGVEAPAHAPGAVAAAQGEGYRITPHVLRYYETTKA
jgi:hypothetical protein